MTCGLFTATGALRRLLRHTGLPYSSLGKASAARVANPEDWGTYYETDPEVCFFSEVVSLPHTLSPRAVRARIKQAEAC